MSDGATIRGPSEDAAHWGQVEVSSDLGRRVRAALERLIQAFGPHLIRLDARVMPRHVFHAATRIIMRLVACLFAEARDMLPREHPIYRGSYGIHGLIEIALRCRALPDAHRLMGAGAWPRILALFRLVYEGSPHGGLLLPAYGGSLFAPGDADSDKPVSRALAVFERIENAPSDDCTHRLALLLGRARVKVRDERGQSWVEGPVDYARLSSEHIGILYEGLLDFELCRAPADEPIAVLASHGARAVGLHTLAASSDPAWRAIAASLAAWVPGRPLSDAGVLRVIEPGEWFLARARACPR